MVVVMHDVMMMIMNNETQAAALHYRVASCAPEQ
jgi:hypothetical protein